jgi:hypothetical protein
MFMNLYQDVLFHIEGKLYKAEWCTDVKDPYHHQICHYLRLSLFSSGIIPIVEIVKHRCHDTILNQKRR